MIVACFQITSHFGQKILTLVCKTIVSVAAWVLCRVLTSSALAGFVTSVSEASLMISLVPVSSFSLGMLSPLSFQVSFLVLFGSQCVIASQHSQHPHQQCLPGAVPGDLGSPSSSSTLMPSYS